MIFISILACGLSQQCDKVLLKQHKYDRNRLPHLQPFAVHTENITKKINLWYRRKEVRREILKTCKQLEKSAKAFPVTQQVICRYAAV